MPVSPPFNINETSPAASDIISAFPANEQLNRDIIESWLTFISDPTTGLLKPTAFPNPLVITSTDAGAGSGPTLTLYRDSASPAANDAIGALAWQGEDSAGNAHVYSYIYTEIIDPTNGSEDGTMHFVISVAGVDNSRLALNAAGGALVGTLTAGGINVSDGSAQTGAVVRARGGAGSGNAFEFGHSNPAGYGSTIGHYTTSGIPFIAFHGEHGTNANTIRTRGLPASIWRSDAGGGMVFENALTGTADNQTPTHRLRIGASGDISWNNDLDTYIYGVSADTLQFVTGGIQRLLINNSSGAYNGTFTANAFLAPSEVRSELFRFYNDAGLDTYIQRVAENEFHFVAGGTETARLTQTSFNVGRVNFNPAAVGGGINTAGIGSFSVSNDGALIVNRIGTEGIIVNIRSNNTTVGSISWQSSDGLTHYNTTSDEQLKNFIGVYNPEEAIRVIRADPVREFIWNEFAAASGKSAIGWGAQTSYAVSKNLATSGRGKPGDDDYEPWGVDQSKRTPYLWAAMTNVLDRLEAIEKHLAI